MDNNFDPEKYGMLFCFECDGNGKLLNDSKDSEICQKCGDGLLREEENSNPQLFHTALWIWEKKHFWTNFLRKRFDPSSLNSQNEEATLVKS
jgi:hypothetical protein